MNALRAPSLVLALALAAAGTWQVAQAAWIHGKAVLAQVLIARAWRLADGRETAPRPWPGADLRPVARLSLPARGLQVLVLDAASPRALAFGPGVLDAGAGGRTVLVAHRDTHFAFLRELVPGDDLELEAPRGTRVRYRVDELRVVHQGDFGALDEAGAGSLVLVTCYPFDAVRPGTAWRYVVVAERIG